ncbi:MAG: AAA family ATPase [Pseudomonadota bacterium]
MNSSAGAASIVRPHFPFSALEGQPGLQRALQLCAVDPMIGGLLIEGPRGTAKSTSARALATLLPDGARFVNLPLAATEEQVVGTLDIDAALKGQGVQWRPGLLARAHGGVLYVDEVNLLADHLVDVLLDVSASGVNIVERDGVSHSHAARLVLIGTMNPEEGALRPQLLDRFGLYVQLSDPSDSATRQRIVRSRLAFDADPMAFIDRHREAEAALRTRLAAAKARLNQIDYTDGDIARVADLCREAQVEGVRADLTLLRAARANAALEGNSRMVERDVNTVAPWVLAHRRGDGNRLQAAGPSPPGARDGGGWSLPSTPDGIASGESEGRHDGDRAEARGATTPASAPDDKTGHQGGVRSGAEPRASGEAEAPRPSEGGDPIRGPELSSPNRSKASGRMSDSDSSEWGALSATRAPPPAAVKGVRPLPVPRKKA